MGDEVAADGHGMNFSLWVASTALPAGWSGAERRACGHPHSWRGSARARWKRLRGIGGRWA